MYEEFQGKVALETGGGSGIGRATVLGYAGKILRVDLSTGSSETVSTDEYSRRFLGGRGIAAKIHWDEVPSQTGAFDPDNRLTFITGPLTATTGFAGSRWQVCGKSPISNTFSFGNLGGSWGAALKTAGYDGLILHGKAESPVYLWICDDRVKIRSASHLWGKGAISCREELKRELGASVRVVAIGPGGENRVSFSVLLSDNDSSGAGGLAAVMGSKNLKAVAVRGANKIKVASPEGILEIKQIVRAMRSEMDTQMLLSNVPELRTIPSSKIKKDVCYGCIGGCVRVSYSDNSGRKAKFTCGSSMFYIDPALKFYGEHNDVPFYATKLCDNYGLNAWELQMMIEWLTRCHVAGILSEEDTGIPFSKLGSLDYIEILIKKIAFREGIGDLLAEGTQKASEAMGAEAHRLFTDHSTVEYSYAYSPRMYLTNAIFYAMEPRQPIQHLHEVIRCVLSWVPQALGQFDTGITSEVLRSIAKRFWGSEDAADFSTYEGKALAAVRIQDRQYAKESLILCDFMWPMTLSVIPGEHVGDPTLESRLYSAVTGEEVDEQSLNRIGERVFNLQRAILTREGRKGREYDSLEEFNFTIPLEEDQSNPNCLAPGKNGELFSRKGMVVDREKFEQMKTEYYRIRDWDPASGLQTERKLVDLGLPDIAEEMKKEGLIAMVDAK